MTSRGSVRGSSSNSGHQRTQKNLKLQDVEVLLVFFDNLGRNKRLDFLSSLDVSLRQLGEILSVDRSKETSGYMIKRISVYGGCLGGQRR